MDILLTELLNERAELSVTDSVYGAFIAMRDQLLREVG